MKTILITGANGFIGKNLRLKLSLCTDYVLRSFDKDNTHQQLSDYVAEADYIFHLAGVNKPLNPDEFYTGNVDLTHTLLDLLKQHHKTIPLIVTSSIQAGNDSLYGKSKKQMEQLLEDFHHATHCPVLIFRVPNVFGKWCRPNYNSAVATFCYNIAHDLPITVSDPNALVTLIYIDDLIAHFEALLTQDVTTFSLFPSLSTTTTLTLSTLTQKIYDFALARKTLLMPDLTSHFDQALYATYISYLEPTNLSYQPPVTSDQRGWLGELIKSEGLGQFFVSTTKPGITRGNHYHHTKTEKFIVIQGDALIKLRQIGSDKVTTYAVSGDQLTIVDIPVGYTHAITNAGSSDLITLFWSNQIFAPENPDTFFEEVILCQN
ncbi:MAG: NAD-dependent epimerase/dehydratase family protein [Cellulosilyticaceae bacterium]